jgi:succinate dehydrogenase/fumarate reductase-like Fe-S protein
MPDRFFYFEGHKIPFGTGMTVAAALLRAGEVHFRQTQVNDQPRGAFCMMGACFECLLVIDGHPNRQGCMTPAVQDMKVLRQQAHTMLENG